MKVQNLRKPRFVEIWSLFPYSYQIEFFNGVNLIPIPRMFFAFLLLAFSIVNAEAKGQKKAESCSGNHYLKFVLTTDGKGQTASFFAVSPGSYAEDTRQAFEKGRTVGAKAGEKYDAFSYRPDEKGELAAFEYLGEATFLGEARILIQTPAENAASFESSKQRIQEVDPTKVHGIMVVKRNRGYSGAKDLLKDLAKAKAYVMKNLILLAGVERDGVKLAGGCVCSGFFGGLSCCQGGCNKMGGFCQEDGCQAKPSGSCALTWCTCPHDIEG